MRTTIDIPDETYRALKLKAVMEGKTFREIAVRGLDRETREPVPKRKVRKLKLPIIPSKGNFVINPTEEELLEAYIPSRY